jgi:hypothetical protein
LHAAAISAANQVKSRTVPLMCMGATTTTTTTIALWTGRAHAVPLLVVRHPCMLCTKPWLHVTFPTRVATHARGDVERHKVVLVHQHGRVLEDIHSVESLYLTEPCLG